MTACIPKGHHVYPVVNELVDSDDTEQEYYLGEAATQDIKANIEKTCKEIAEDNEKFMDIQADLSRLYTDLAYCFGAFYNRLSLLANFQELFHKYDVCPALLQILECITRGATDESDGDHEPLSVITSSEALSYIPEKVELL